jgi:hypothetical protein
MMIATIKKDILPLKSGKNFVAYSPRLFRMFFATLLRNGKGLTKYKVAAMPNRKNTIVNADSSNCHLDS